MARYGCLVISVIIALLILVVTSWFWSGWFNRPIGHAPAPLAAVATIAPVQAALPNPITRHPGPAPPARRVRPRHIDGNRMPARPMPARRRVRPLRNDNNPATGATRPPG